MQTALSRSVKAGFLTRPGAAHQARHYRCQQCRQPGERYRNLSDGYEYLLIDHFIYLTVCTNLLTTICLQTDARRLSKTPRAKPSNLEPSISKLFIESRALPTKGRIRAYRY